MQGTEDLYYVFEKNVSDSSSTFTIELNPNHSIFEGHFPEKPILPGVIQLEIIRELFSMSINQEAKMLSMSNCKYLAFIEPQSCGELKIKLNFEGKETRFSVNATISNQKVSFLKMKGIFE